MSNVNINFTLSQARAFEKVKGALTLSGFYKVSGIEQITGDGLKVAVEDSNGHHLISYINISKRGKVTGNTVPHWLEDTTKSTLLDRYGLHLISDIRYEDYWYRTL